MHTELALQARHCLKYTHGFSRLVPSVITIVAIAPADAQRAATRFTAEERGEKRLSCCRARRAPSRSRQLI
ncbi:hypothetical protein ACT02A_29970, partial [Klebsiella quasipneumoniae]